MNMSTMSSSKLYHNNFFKIITSILIITINFKVTSSKNCSEILKENFIYYNPMNITNPWFSTGIGYNEMGKYENCQRLNNTKFISFEFKFVVTQPAVLKQQIFMGLCLPLECADRTELDSLRDFLINKTGISSDSILFIDNDEESLISKKFDIWTIIGISFLSVYFIIGSGILYHILSLCYKKNPYQRISSFNSANFFQSDKELKNDSFNVIESNLPLNISYSNETKEKFEEKLHLIDVINYHKNYEFLFSNVDDKGQEEIRYLNAISFFLSLFYMEYQLVVLIFWVPIRNPLSIFDAFQVPTLQLIFNSDFSTDLFITTSGFIISFLGINNLQNWKNSNFLEVFFEFILNIFKTWPLIVGSLFFYWKIFPYFIDGPLSSYLLNMELDSCNVEYPYIMSLINNFTYGSFESSYPFCISWTWFLINILQYSFVGLCLVFIYAKKPAYFYPIFFTISFVFMVIEAWIILDNKFGVNIAEIKIDVNYFKFYYFKFYTRISPYLMGFLFGILFAKYKISLKENKFDDLRTFFDEIKHNSFISFLFLFFGFLIMLFFILITSWSYLEYKWYDTLKFFYLFLAKKLFCLGCFMFCIPFMLGSSTKLAWMLDNYIIHVLSKIRVSAIIIMGFFCRLYLFDKRDYFFYNSFANILIGVSLITCSFIIGLFVTVIFEIPLIKFSEYLRMNTLLAYRISKNRAMVRNSEE
jgi:hypothetical protein